jgi:molybdopterin-guanine dinucleotide biosynthesis protein A
MDVEIDGPHSMRSYPAVLKATLLLLAGGESKRMGQPKALLPVGKVTLVEWIADRMAGSFTEVLVSANDPQLVPRGLRMVRDRRAGHLGPLAGIEAGLAAATNEVMVAVACDMPRATPELAEKLVQLSEGHDAAVPRIGGRPEPAFASYRQTAAWAIGEALDRGRLKAAGALLHMDVVWLDDADRKLFWNINTPKDYQIFLSAR